MSAEMARTGLRAPVNVTWEVTLQCNLSCIHCLSDAGKEHPMELTQAESLSLIDELASLRVFQVNIGGGEPFLRTGFVDLLEYAHKKGLVTCVSTNGTLIDRSLARRLARMRLLYLQVSLDGASEEVNDRIRGRGTFRRVRAALDRLSSEGAAFSINTVLTRTNYPELDELRSLAGRYRADLRVSRFRPSGRGKDSRKELGPKTHHLESFARWLEEDDLVRTGDSFFSLTSERRRRKGLDMCGAAKMTCCVSPEGNVYPCAFLQEPEFLAGSIRSASLKELWEQSPVFKQFRNLRVDTCMDCARFDVCRGGCPAMAYHTYHDIAMPDPECLMNLKRSGLAV